jgi:putative PIN family toxin of toxin-antitoxin system
VLLDTNVLVSALHFRGSVPRQCLELVIGGGVQLVTSPQLLDELEEVLVDHVGWDAGRAAAARGLLEELATVVTPTTRPQVCRDPDDDEVLAAAELGRVEAVVTGDKDLLVLEAYAGALILVPAEFVFKLAEGEGFEPPRA